MRNLLAFMAAAVLTFAGVGWYLDWFRIQTAPSASGHQRVEVDIDSNKITSDIQKGSKEVLQKAEGKLQQVNGPNKQPGETPTTAPANKTTPATSKQ
jgi:hypothetical protein